MEDTNLRGLTRIHSVKIRLIRFCTARTTMMKLCSQAARIWSAVTCHRFAALATCRQSRDASSAPGELDAFPHSTATSRLPKARTSLRTPEWLRLRRAGFIRGETAVCKMKRVLVCALVLGFAANCAVLGAEEFWPSNEWSRATPAEVGLEQGKLEAARDYALSAGGSGYIVRHGRLALTWGDARQLYDLK